MSIPKKIKELWERFMFPLDLLYLAVLVFILLMYFDIYKGIAKTRTRKFNELIKKTYQRISQKHNTRDN